jgi:hypothetical protein
MLTVYTGKTLSIALFVACLRPYMYQNIIIYNALIFKSRVIVGGWQQ